MGFIDFEGFNLTLLSKNIGAFSPPIIFGSQMAPRKIFLSYRFPEYFSRT